MEDIIYVLTYDKSLVERITDEKIRIKLLGKDNHYRVIYDTQQRPQYLRKKVNTLESYPAIKIGNLRIEDKVLYFDLDNINIPPVKEFGNGKFELRVKLLDSRANEVVNQKSQIEAFQNSEEIKINLSKIAPGSYDVILEVDDLITKTNDFVMIGIKILSENIILGQNIEYDSTEFEKKLLEKKTKVQMNQDISIQRKPVKLQSSKVKGSKTIRGQSIASYAEPLKKALVKTSEYCSLLQEMSLYFFCREKVVESVNLDYLRELKPVTEMKQPEENIYISNNTGNISSTDYARPARWGSDFMGKSIANRNIVNLNYLYDYQLFQNEGKIEERRELLRENGERVNIMNAPLKTRFKYHNIIFGPMVFGEKQHQFYKYEIIKKTRKKRRNILIVEATPVDPEAAQMLTGRLWIDEKDHSIIRVEATHRSIENYEYIELYARKNMLIPEIKIVQEYNIEKNGVRFPSSATIEEAYITPQKKKIVLSSIKVKYSDYKFFTVGTKVTEEKIKK